MQKDDEKVETKNETLYTKEEVQILMKRRVERTHKAFFRRYDVENLEGLDEIVKLGYKYKKLFLSDETFQNINNDYLLDELVGLENVKNKINRIACFILKNQSQKLRPSMNYVFIGNPGTGKTVVARALTKTFYEKGIICENKLVEIDRSYLIGEYTGQTAPKVRKVFESALGGVLFIDEAYLLQPSKEDVRDYCHEALMMLCKMMEDYRGKLVVIFAGYEKETLEMLKGNKGLKSRINSIIHFKNFTNDELRNILKLHASKYEYILDEDVENKIVEILNLKRINPKFANAREIRNILEGIMEFHAARTIDEPWDRTIIMEDLIKWQIENKIVINSDIADA